MILTWPFFITFLSTSVEDARFLKTYNAVCASLTNVAPVRKSQFIINNAVDQPLSQCTKTCAAESTLFRDIITSTKNKILNQAPVPVVKVPSATAQSNFLLDSLNSLPTAWTPTPSFYSFLVYSFLIALVGTLAYCIFLVILRWNVFHVPFIYNLYSKFPVYATALFYSTALFLLSLFLVYGQFYTLSLDSLTVQSVIELYFQNIWTPALQGTGYNWLKLNAWDNGLLFSWTVINQFACQNHLPLWNVDNYYEYILPLVLLANKYDSSFVNFSTNVSSMASMSPYWATLETLYPTLGNFQFGGWKLDFVAPFFRESFIFAFSFDGLSVVFIALTTFVIVLCICVSWYSYKREFAYTLIILLFVTQFLIVIVFSTIDLILFYIAFESVLIPLFFLVGIFGSRERRIKAAYYLMFYTLFGSVPFLIGILYIWYKTGQTNILLLEPFLYGSFSAEEITFLWFLFLPGFAFKVPLYPFHLWLPEAHVEAPTIGSVILAGLVLKLGGYGFIRFSVGLLFWGGVTYLNIVYWFCVLSMLCAILCAACQIDLKRIIAYGSISHMGLVTLCIFLGSQAGLESAMVMMLGHGFVSSALFILVGGLYERYHSRNVRYYGGLYKTLPRFGTLLFCFVLFDIGVPGSPSFVAELLAFVSVVQESISLAVFMSFPVIIGAGVSLLVCSRVLFGMNERRYFTSYQTLLMNFNFWTMLNSEKVVLSDATTGVSSAQVVQEHIVAENHDFLPNEIFVLICLFVSALFLGIFPNLFVQYFVADLEQILQLAMWL